MSIIARIESAAALATSACEAGAPLLAAAVVLEVAFALVARASSPAQTHALFAPIRALGLLAVMAIVLDRVGEALATTLR